MNKYQNLENKLANCEKVLGTTMSMINSPLVVEKMNRDDLDFILFDAEHGIFNSENLVPCLQVCRLMGLPSFVRVPDAEYHLMSRMMYMGADGIMLPRTESLEQVKTAVEAIRFAPIGKTGCGGHGQFRKGEGYEGFQKSRYLFVQIESQPGIDLLPEIIEKYGDDIAGIIIGPYDMSVMLGTPFNIRSEVMIEAIQKTFDICNERKMSCGIFCDDEVLSKKYRDMGANVLWACTDNNFFMRGYNQVFDALAEME